MWACQHIWFEINILRALWLMWSCKSRRTTSIKRLTSLTALYHQKPCPSNSLIYKIPSRYVTWGEEQEGGQERSSCMDSAYLIGSNWTGSEESEAVMLCGKCAVPVVLSLSSFPWQICLDYLNTILRIPPHLGVSAFPAGSDWLLNEMPESSP